MMQKVRGPLEPTYTGHVDRVSVWTSRKGLVFAVSGIFIIFS